MTDEDKKEEYLNQIESCIVVLGDMGYSPCLFIEYGLIVLFNFLGYEICKMMNYSSGYITPRFLPNTPHQHAIQTLCSLK